jgi:hypothetical protein
MVGMNEPTIAQRIEHRRRDEVHVCFRPGCGDRARTVLYVTGPLMIANQRLDEGDWVDPCWPHYEELQIAAKAIPGPLPIPHSLIEGAFADWRALALLWIAPPI